MSFYRKLRDYVDDQLIIDQLIDAGSRIAMIGRSRGIVRSSGVSFDLPILMPWEFEDGLAVRLEAIIDVQRLLVALGGEGLA